MSAPTRKRVTRRAMLKGVGAVGATSLMGSATGGLASAQAGEAVSAKAAGFRMPLESDPHERTFMQWPARAGIYGSQRALDAVRDKIALIAQAIAKHEPVVVLARPEQLAEATKRLATGVTLWPIETEDLWCRDSGPTFLVNAKGELAVSELNFNGWGGKQEHKDDGRIARRVAERLELPVYESGVVGEGGGIETDGAGTLLAHESCWINANRNAGDKARIEGLLKAALGATQMIWAPGVKGADITDYHIDALARFVKPGQVLIQLPAKVTADDPWSTSAYQTYEVLKQARDAEGRKLDIVVVQEPVDIRSRARDFVSSYVNYFVCNGAVIGAEFGDDTADAEAARILGQLYPDRQVVSLNVDPIGEAGGGIHCSTQQQPKGKA